MSRMRSVTRSLFVALSVRSSVAPEASPVPPWATAPRTSAPRASARRQHGAELAPLLGRERFRGVGHGLNEPLARRVIDRNLIGAQLFDGRALDRLLGQQLPC